METTKRERSPVTLGNETGMDRRIAILLRLKPGERFVVPVDHACGLPANCYELIDWHRAAGRAGLKIKARHDDIGRIVIWADGENPE